MLCPNACKNLSLGTLSYREYSMNIATVDPVHTRNIEVEKIDQTAQLWVLHVI
jgi:hypothetical protein